MRFINSQEDLAELPAFITLNHHADDMTQIVGAGLRHHGDIQIVTPYVGTTHPLKRLPDPRRAKDIARLHLKHRVKLFGRKDVIASEGYLASAISRPRRDVKGHNKLISALLVKQLLS